MSADCDWQTRRACVVLTRSSASLVASCPDDSALWNVYIGFVFFILQYTEFLLM